MTIKSRRYVLLEALDRIMSLVQTLPCVQGDLDDLRLALAEALSNAVIHGNREDPDKTVGICAGCDGQSQLLIAVTDQGDGFDPVVLPDPTTAENICSSHGRGVFLMKRLVDDVEFNLGGRQIVLRKRIATQLKTIEVSGSTVRTLDR
jgi:serine/threonine-protein kinase RsbW